MNAYLQNSVCPNGRTNSPAGRGYARRALPEAGTGLMSLRVCLPVVFPPESESNGSKWPCPRLGLRLPSLSLLSPLAITGDPRPCQLFLSLLPRYKTRSIFLCSTTCYYQFIVSLTIHKIFLFSQPISFHFSSSPGSIGYLIITR